MRLPLLVLRPGDREELECRVRSNTVEARDAERARLVLMAAGGATNRDIGAAIGMHYNQVAVWRRRYAQFGLTGLADGDRPGRPPVYDHDDVLLLVKTVTEPPPDAATRWTMEAIARRLNEHGVAMSASQVWRICKGLDLKPWQTESWMTSHDPEFWAKAADVCGLYLDPPDNAVVWSVDEKSGIQAKSRVNPTKPAVPGIARRREFEYRRHGTAVLFAGLNVHEGDVAGWVTDSTRADNFVEFLDARPRIFLHNTPTHASWLNQVELFFSILERRLLRHGEFDSVDDLAERIIAFINDYNRRARPFRWTYDGRPLKVA